MTNQQILDLADSLVAERFNNPKKDRTLVGYWKSGFLDGYRQALGLPINESKESLKEDKDEYDIKYDLIINALRLCWKADLILEDTYKRYKNKSVKIKNIDDAYDFAYTILYGKENDMLKAFHELMNLLHIEDFEKHFNL
jgi:hypothetical protein